MTGKPNIMTAEDTEKAKSGLEQPSKRQRAVEDGLIQQPGLPPERETLLKSLLNWLEEHYEVKDFPLEDLHETQLKTLKTPPKDISRYEQKKEAHASRMYARVLAKLSNLRKGSSENHYFQEVVSYYRKNLTRMERDGHEALRIPRLRFMVRLGTFYASNGDYTEFIRLYRQFVKTCAKFDLRSSRELMKAITRYEDDLATQFFEEVSKKTQRVYGNDPKLIDAFINAINYGLDDKPCLIMGETGTGKEIVANLMHQVSDRHLNNFWAVNCAGFTESLFNSEIQGLHWSAATGVESRLGAFLKASGRSNAKKNKGYFLGLKKSGSSTQSKSTQNKHNEILCEIDGEELEYPTRDQLKPLGGTVFLDEINSMPMGLQSALLRIIEEREVNVVGEDRKRKYAGKVIAASNNIEIGSETEDNFRRDLYHRLAQGIVTVPALRKMPDSIPYIAKEMVNDMAEEFGYELGHTKFKTQKETFLWPKEIEISKQAQDKLANYRWPGNHRELRNVLYRAIKNMMLDDRLKLGPKDIQVGAASKGDMAPGIFDGKTHGDLEKSYMEYLLQKTSGNITEMMRLAGFNSRQRIYSRLEKYHLS